MTFCVWVKYIMQSVIVGGVIMQCVTAPVIWQALWLSHGLVIQNELPITPHGFVLIFNKMKFLFFLT
jgi:hypothetical protein